MGDHLTNCKSQRVGPSPRRKGGGPTGWKGSAARLCAPFTLPPRLRLPRQQEASDLGNRAPENDLMSDLPATKFHHGIALTDLPLAQLVETSKTAPARSFGS